MWKEFKEFALTGNLVDVAVAFVLGAAFGRVISAFTDGIVAPVIGLLLGGADFNKMRWVLQPGVPEVKDAAGTVTQAAVSEVAIQYGMFITSIIDFLIVAFVMFLIVRSVNSMRKKQPEAPAAPAADVMLLTEIRDLLKNR